MIYLSKLISFVKEYVSLGLVVDVYSGFLQPLKTRVNSVGCVLELEEVHKLQQVSDFFNALIQVHFCFYYSVHVEVKPNAVGRVRVLLNESYYQSEHLAHYLNDTTQCLTS